MGTLYRPNTLDIAMVLVEVPGPTIPSTGGDPSQLSFNPKVRVCACVCVISCVCTFSILLVNKHIHSKLAYELTSVMCLA